MVQCPLRLSDAAPRTATPRSRLAVTTGFRFTALCFLRPHAAPCAQEGLERRMSFLRLGLASTVRNARLALSNFYNITVGIADVAARLAILILWLRDELGSAASP